jgi:hypothetical protein
VRTAHHLSVAVIALLCEHQQCGEDGRRALPFPELHVDR